MWKNVISRFNDLGTLIKCVQQDKNVEYQQIAKQANIEPKRMEEIENNIVYPSKEELKRLSGVLGISYDELLIVTGYNKLTEVPSYFTNEGEEIDVNSMIKEIYYRNPSLLPKLVGIVLEYGNN